MIVRTFSDWNRRLGNWDRSLSYLYWNRRLSNKDRSLSNWDGSLGDLYWFRSLGDSCNLNRFDSYNYWRLGNRDISHSWGLNAKDQVAGAVAAVLFRANEPEVDKVLRVCAVDDLAH